MAVLFVTLRTQATIEICASMSPRRVGGGTHGARSDAVD